MAVKSQSLPNLAGLYVRNLAGNLIGNLTIVSLNAVTPLEFLKDWKVFISQGGWAIVPIFIVTACIIAIFLQYVIQHPISSYLSRPAHGEKAKNPEKLKAEQRLINLPVLIGLTNFGMWLVLDIIFTPLMYFLLEMKLSGFIYNFFRILMVGLISSFISFFLIDDYARQKIVPVFFPDGRLTKVPGTVNISILRRIRVLFGVGTNAPMVLLCVTIGFAIWELDETIVTTAQFSRDILTFSAAVFIIFIIMSLSLNLLVSRSILQPINNMLAFARKVGKGHFRQKVRVVSNDELGIMGDGMNAMAEGLIERDRFRRGLYLAQEIQQALLPQKCPLTNGLEVAARTLYCDETGGDYFDFIGTDAKELNAIIGDVSGHGISSAILMASVRAFLRQRYYLPGSLSQIMADVNRQLVLDVEDSGSFMTLFYLKIDPKDCCIRWIGAGHEPAIRYNPISDKFDEMKGQGPALGISEHAIFAEDQKKDLTQGQVIVMATDGFWEAHNWKGDMFGKKPLYDIIRQNSAATAEEILEECFQSVADFQTGLVREDDITMVVIKIIGLNS
jgi:sigma-B regulation protein RsbU (phosphoserine phosphatase)